MGITIQTLTQQKESAHTSQNSRVCSLQSVSEGSFPVPLQMQPPVSQWTSWKRPFVFHHVDLIELQFWTRFNSGLAETPWQQSIFSHSQSHSDCSCLCREIPPIKLVKPGYFLCVSAVVIDIGFNSYCTTTKVKKKKKRLFGLKQKYEISNV